VNGGAPPTASRIASRLRKLLGKRWVQGLGSVAAIVALIVSLWVIFSGQESKSTSATQNQISGNCNAQGAQNNVTCQSAPTSRPLGKVSLELVPVKSWIFAGSHSELPTPPDYPAIHVLNHSRDWSGWLQRQPKMYAVDPIFHVVLAAGADDLVVVKKAEMQVFRRTPASRSVTAVKCEYGAGGNPGHYIIIDTVEPKTWFISFGGGSGDMPPGSISVHGLDSTQISVIIQSHFRYLYEGMLTVTADVNGKEENYQLGSPEVPLRWISADRIVRTPTAPSGDMTRDGFVDSLGYGYDWNLAQKSWAELDLSYDNGASPHFPFKN
jgi:hypothetical protein